MGIDPIWGRYRRSYAAEKPYYKNNDQHSAENTAQAGTAVTTVGVISSAAAEYQN
jgi:hypothetical protein